MRIKTLFFGLMALVFIFVEANAVLAQVPTASEIRRCTLCDSGWGIRQKNMSLLNSYQDKLVWVAIRNDKGTHQKVYVAGVTKNNLIVHNQRSIRKEVNPTKLANAFGSNFYQFGPGEIIDKSVSIQIEKIGLMRKAPFLRDLPNPWKVTSNSDCGKSYPIDGNNWEKKFLPAGSLFCRFDESSDKAKFNKRGIERVATFDCLRGVNWWEVRNYYALGPWIGNVPQGITAAEVLSSKPARFPRKILGDCQNITEVNNTKEILVTVERTAPDSTRCIVSLKASFGNNTVTMYCWKDIFISLNFKGNGPPIDLWAYFPELTFKQQFQPHDGSALWVGIAEESNCGEYDTKSTSWQAKIPQKVIFAQVDEIGVNEFKIKINVRTSASHVWTLECKRVQETRGWSEAVLKKHCPTYNFCNKQYRPTSAGKTVWTAY